MISFTLNGILRQEEKDQNLLTYLRVLDADRAS